MKLKIEKEMIRLLTSIDASLIRLAGEVEGTSDEGPKIEAPKEGRKAAKQATKKKAEKR